MCFSHPHEALSSLSVRVFQVGCFHILEIIVSFFSYSLSLSFFPHFGSKPYAHKFRRASWHLPKLHGNPTQTLCFPSDFLGLAWVFDGSSMGFWWHLWLAGHCPCGSTPHRLRGGTRQPEKEMVFLEGVPHPFFQFECAIYGHSMGVWWFDGGEPKSGNVGGGLVGVWWGFGSGI